MRINSVGKDEAMDTRRRDEISDLVWPQFIDVGLISAATYFLSLGANALQSVTEAIGGNISAKELIEWAKEYLDQHRGG